MYCTDVTYVLYTYMYLTHGSCIVQPPNTHVLYTHTFTVQLHVLCHYTYHKITCTCTNCTNTSSTNLHSAVQLHLLRYNAYFFPTMVLFSVFLGFCGIDRLCMGYCCLGLAKMFTLGGLGVWWLVDILLLLSGNLQPYDNYYYVWERFY